MINLDTGRVLHNGQRVKLGDTLKGPNTHEMVVLFEPILEGLVVEAVREDLKIMTIPLDDYIANGFSLEITGSILKSKQ